MAGNLKEFWDRLQDSVDVMVAADDPELLLGVREGFRRFFRHGLQHDVSVTVRQRPAFGSGTTLWDSAGATLEMAHRSACGLRECEPRAQFCVGAEEGFVGLGTGNEVREFVHCWAVVASELGVACGSSGAIEIPGEWIHAAGRGPSTVSVPGTRRRGGLVGSLTGGLETRRLAMAEAVTHALSTLFYGVVEIRPTTARWGV